jgi:hypothetical protein
VTQALASPDGSHDRSFVAKSIQSGSVDRSTACQWSAIGQQGRGCMRTVQLPSSGQLELTLEDISEDRCTLSPTRSAGTTRERSVCVPRRMRKMKIQSSSCRHEASRLTEPCTTSRTPLTSTKIVGVDAN